MRYLHVVIFYLFETIYLGFTGIDAPYQIPEHPDVVVDTSTVSIDLSVEIIIEKLAERVSEVIFKCNSFGVPNIEISFLYESKSSDNERDFEYHISVH